MAERGPNKTFALSTQDDVPVYKAMRVLTLDAGVELQDTITWFIRRFMQDEILRERCIRDVKEWPKPERRPRADTPTA